MSQPAPSAPFIRISGLTKTFGTVKALDEVSFDIAKGQVVTLLGPSGCGKSTTLRIIAGLEIADAGEIDLDGRPILSVARGINLPPERRDMGMVFQSYAIWPHLTVAENVAYPLRLRGMPSREIKERVAEALRLVDLQAQASRDAPKLSGGQQQRVALARALVYEPKVMLLDEPLSNLDVKLREQMRFELKLLQQNLNLTLVYVTHDQAEALSLSDQIVLMHDGRVEQRGTPRELYDNPATEFARDFLGKTIALPGRIEAVDGGTAAVSLLDVSGRLQCATQAAWVRPGAEVTVAVRPEKVRLVAAAGQGGNHLTGKIETVLYQGERSECAVRIGNSLFSLYVPADANLTRGREVVVQFDPEAISLWPR
jgi:ABC-type Fe3+/spermidine/putrescine transport system ATPase subunit